jgi:hypothetical protein
MTDKFAHRADTEGDRPSAARYGSLVPELIESLRLLAAPDDVQRASLPDWVALPAELFLTFSDVYDVIDTTCLPSGTVPLLSQIDDLASGVLRDQADEQRDATGREVPDIWQEVRALALAALESLDVDYEPPDLGFIRFVRVPSPRLRWPRIRFRSDPGHPP